MYWESLPIWFWAIYYLFLLTTLGFAAFNVVTKQHKSLSILGSDSL
ncbi:ABC-type multidrug transport system permease subunit [Lederbergia galactosidilyticus]|nr:ABC-type multidrug transport system permease subunit [Lederbergia galactosidilytica]